MMSKRTWNLGLGVLSGLVMASALEALEPEPKALCAESRTEVFQIVSTVDTTRHAPVADGHFGHIIFAQAEYECRCSSDCFQTCVTKRVSEKHVDDWGAVTGDCHVVSLSSVSMSGSEIYDARETGPASCSVTVKATWRECRDCECSDGASDGDASTSQEVHRYEKTEIHVCEPCTPKRDAGGERP